MKGNGILWDSRDTPAAQLVRGGASLNRRTLIIAGETNVFRFNFVRLTPVPFLHGPVVFNPRFDEDYDDEERRTRAGAGPT
jgi:hypothetical protein